MDDAMMAWAKENGLEDLYKQYLEECDEIAEQCEEEGYPSHGSNYDLRIENLQKSYPELFAEQEDLEREDHLQDAEHLEVYNLTPHAITMMKDVDGKMEEVVQHPASMTLARCKTETVQIGEANGIPITATKFGDVFVSRSEVNEDGTKSQIEEPFPEERSGRVYLVSSLVAEALGNRNDAFIPNESVRDEQGRIIGCQSYGRITPADHVKSNEEKVSVDKRQDNHTIKPFEAKVVNLTPHAITMVGIDQNGNSYPAAVYPASGDVARCEEKTVEIGSIDGVPITKTQFGDVGIVSKDGDHEPMPPVKADTIYLVSTRTAQAMKDRPDIFIPNESVRDEQGRIVGCKSFGVLDPDILREREMLQVEASIDTEEVPLTQAELEMCRDVLNRTAYINDDGDLLDENRKPVLTEDGKTHNYIFDRDMQQAMDLDPSLYEAFDHIQNVPQKKNLTLTEAMLLARDDHDLGDCRRALDQTACINEKGDLLDENMKPVLHDYGVPYNFYGSDMQRSLLLSTPLRDAIKDVPQVDASILKAIEYLPKVPEYTHEDIQMVSDAVVQNLQYKKLLEYRDLLSQAAYVNKDGDLLDKDMDLVRDDFGGECNIYDIDMVCLDIHDSSIQKEIQEILSQFPSAESAELEAKMRAEAEQQQSLTNEEAGSRDCPTLADVMRENADLDACVDAVIQAEYINADGYLLDENMHPVLSENGDPFNINDFDMQQAAAQNPLIQKTIDRIPAAPEKEVQTLADAMKQVQEQDSRQQDLWHEEQEMGKSDPTKNDVEL